ncbi:MAG: helix-turn-helix transcriptional regulator [Bacteroidales bacterium]|nr:helix-turn-helix transcriptional regulator [Bacteroidales bacterium]
MGNHSYLKRKNSHRYVIRKKIRGLRDENGVLQRQLASLLEIDTPMFSKIERGDRRAKREQVIKLAEYFHQDENEMLTLWLADKVLDAVDGEQELSLQAIEVAQEQIKEL